MKESYIYQIVNNGVLIEGSVRIDVNENWTGKSFKYNFDNLPQVQLDVIETGLFAPEVTVESAGLRYLRAILEPYLNNTDNLTFKLLETISTTPPEVPVNEPSPAPNTAPAPTPAELEKQVEQEKARRQKTVGKIKLQKALSAGVTVSTVTALKGLDRINQSVNTKVEALKAKAVGQIFTMGSDLGITGLDTGIPRLPSICPTSEVLDNILNLRNSLGSELETVAVYINIVDNSLNITSDLLKGTITTATALSLLKTATSLGVKFAPTVPGAVSALISDLDDVRTLLTFKTDGTPKLPELKRAVDLGSTYISQASSTLNTILGILSIIDQALLFCGRTPAPNGDNLNNLLNKAKVGDSLYKGFSFNIVEEPFSPTVNRKIGQALNSQGIVLLQTEPSFTADPQVLIEELKLIIDRDNLKAN